MGRLPVLEAQSEHGHQLLHRGLATSPADQESSGTCPGGPLSTPQPLGLQKDLDVPQDVSNLL